MITKEEYSRKFKRCINEYIDITNDLDEVGDDQQQGTDTLGSDSDMGGGPDMGGDPGMSGGPDMGGDPGMGGGPDMGGDQGMGSGPDMGGDPGMGGADGQDNANAQPPQGFQPQGVDDNTPMDGMGANGTAGQEDMSMGPDGAGQAPESGEDEEVIDVDDLTDSQEETEKKVDALSKKFERVMASLDGIEKRISDIDAHTNQYLGTIKGEMEKRNPTPMQRMTMRSTKSAPYAMTPNEYMNNYAPENYSDADDNNGADDPQYKITTDDINNFTDYASVAREMNDLKNILGM